MKVTFDGSVEEIRDILCNGNSAKKPVTKAFVDADTTDFYVRNNQIIKDLTEDIGKVVSNSKESTSVFFKDAPNDTDVNYDGKKGEKMTIQVHVPKKMHKEMVCLEVARALINRGYSVNLSVYGSGTSLFVSMM